MLQVDNLHHQKETNYHFFLKYHVCLKQKHSSKQYHVVGREITEGALVAKSYCVEQVQYEVYMLT